MGQLGGVGALERNWEQWRGMKVDQEEVVGVDKNRE